MLKADTSSPRSAAHAVGYGQGVRLGDYDEGLRAAERPVRDRVLREEQGLLARVALADGRAQAAESALDRASARWNRAHARLERLSDTRDAARAEFSPRKGAFYLFISLALVVGDMAIVGMVMADAFGFRWRIDDQTTYIGQLFSNPLRALAEQPELLFLALGIILIGMFVKVLRDTYLGAVAGPDDALRSVRRAEYRVAIVFFVFSVLTLAAVSAMRGDFGVLAPEGATEPVVGEPSGFGLQGWASALIGFTLPFIAAGFFIKGYDCLSNSLAFRSAWADEWWTARALRGRRMEIARRRGDHEDLRTRRADCASPEYLNGLLVSCREEYDTGYRTGLQDLLAGTDGRTMYDALQPIALQKLMATRRS